VLSITSAGARPPSGGASPLVGFTIGAGIVSLLIVLAVAIKANGVLPGISWLLHR